MKIKLSLRNKLQVSLIGISAIIYIIAIGYISVNARKTTYSEAIRLVDATSDQYAKKVQDELNQTMLTARTLAKSFNVYDQLMWDDWDKLMVQMYDYVYKDNSHFYNLWDSWELNKIDSSYTLPYGRISHENFMNGSVVVNDQEYRSMDGDPEMYGGIKAAAKELVLPIYLDQFAERKDEVKVMTTIISPIIKNNEYIGIVGVDLTLDRIQEVVTNLDLEQYPGSYAFMLSHRAKYAGHPDINLLNTEAIFNVKDNPEFDLLQNVERGNSFSFLVSNQDNTNHFISFHPIEIGRTGTPWFIGISVPINSIMAQADRNFMISVLVGIIGILLLGVTIFTITHSIANPIEKITGNLKNIALGHISNSMKYLSNTGDEIEEMSHALNESIDGLNKKAEFAKEIGKGNLNYSFDLLSDSDELGQSLISMRDSLVTAQNEDEKRKVEDERRRWTNEGLAKFAEILRQNNDDIKELGDEIIKNLVYYLEANQGGIFMLEHDDNDEPFLDLLSAFAYDSKKFLEKRIEYGDGVIGTCAIEKDTIYMKDIPEDYIEITSGLGDATPRNLLVVPLKMEENIFGVVEIASFKIIDDFQIEFVEKVAQSIASSLSTVQINIKTNELLEKFQQQSEEMAAQEEEMRQNLEELQATQEEATRKSTQMESLINGLRASNYIVEYDLAGFIVDINDKFLHRLKVKREDIIGTHHAENIEFSEDQKQEYNQFWADLKTGKTRKNKVSLVINEETITLAENYTPLLDENGEVFKILKISNEMTEFE